MKQSQKIQPKKKDLSSITTPKPEEVEEIAKLTVEIPKPRAKIAEFVKNQTDLEAKYKAIETIDIPNLDTDMTTLLTEIKNIQTVEIPRLEVVLVQSEKDIKTYII
jgi:hypothetical protein